MTDREILEQLFEGQKQIVERFDSIENKVDGIENKVDALKSQFEEHEAKDANRHMEIMNEIASLHKDVSAVETITAKNWSDIVHLKAVK